MGVQVISSGTVANDYKEINRETYKRAVRILKKHGIEKFAKPHYADQLEQNLPIRGDVVIFMNQIAREEYIMTGKLPDKTFVWNIVDIGEKGRIPATETEKDAYAEDIYQEIVNNVDGLVRRFNLNRQ